MCTLQHLRIHHPPEVEAGLEAVSVMLSPSRSDSVARALGEDLGDVELQERSALTMLFVLALLC